MYSASLCKEHILEVRKIVKTEDAKLTKALSGCNEQLFDTEAGVSGACALFERFPSGDPANECDE